MIKLRAVLEMFTKGTDKARKETQQINDQLDQAADNAARMNRTLSQTSTGRGALERAGVQDTRNYRTRRGISGARGAEGRNFAALAQASEGVDGSFVGAYAALAANVFALTAAFQTLSNAARVEQLTKGLELMGARGGSALKLTAQNLQLVTDNAISTADAMKVVAQATAAGFSGSEIERLGIVARGASLALGRDMSDSIDRLTKGTIKLEPELLDELGIMTRLDDAVKEYADANNKAVSALTQTERRQAFLNAVLEEGERKFGEISEQISSNPYDQLSASIRKTATELGTILNSFLGPIAEWFASNPFALIVPGLFLVTKALQGLGVTAGIAGLNIEKAFDAAYRKGEGLKSEVKSTQTIFEGVATRPGEIKSLKELSLAFKEEEAAFKQKNEALKLGEKTSLAYNKTLLFTSFAARNAAVAVRSLAVAVATAVLPMLVITATVAALTFAFAEALKAWDKFTGNTKEIKESKAKMKELAEQADETAKQVRMMLEPGKIQAGNAFDAIVNSAKAASDEIEKYNTLLERRNELEEKNIQVVTGFIGIKQVTQAGGNTQRFETETEARAFAGESGIVNKELSSIEGAYKKLENSAIKQLSITKEQAKLLINNYKVILSQLSVEEEAAILQETDLETLQKKLKVIGAISVRFKDLEESAKNINKLSKDLFPKETQNALKEISGEYNSFYNALNTVVDSAVSDTYTRGLANNFQTQKAGLQDILIVLKNQGVEIEGINELIKDSETLEKERKKLTEAKLKGDIAAEVLASSRVAMLELQLGVEIKNSKELFKQVALQTLILSAKEEITKKLITNLSLDEKITRQNGNNLKSALEYNEAIKNAARVATGADITLPQEFTYAYQAKIAEMELNTAREIAKIKKDAINLQMELDIFTLNNEKKKLELQTAVTLSRDAPAKATAKAIVFDEKGVLRPQEEILRQLKEVTSIEVANLVIQNYQLANIKKQEEFTRKLATSSMGAADAETLKFEATKETADAQLEASLKQESINIRNLKNLDQLLKAKNEVTKADKEILDNLVGQSQIYGNIASIFKLETLPALNIQRDILKNQIKLQQDLVNQEKDPGAKAEYQRKLDLLLLQDSAIANQTKSVYQQANAYLIANGIQEMGVITKEESLLVDQIALQNSEKALANLKEELSLEQKLRDVQLTTARQIAQAEATKRGGEVAPQLERDFARTEASNILKNLEAEKKSLVKEKELVVEKMELEKLVMEIRLAAAKQELQNAIDLAPPGTDVSESKSALDKITKVEGLLGTVFDKEKSEIDKQFADRTLILDTQIQGQKAVLDALPKSAREVADRLIGGLKGGLGAALGGIGLTGAAADFYARESQGIINSGMSKEDQDAALANIRSMSSEIQGQQILVEGLQGIYSNLTSGIENAFMAMIDGSKSAKEAFGEMAAAIIKDIAAMIIKMLVFRAVEAGLNMLLPGLGTGVSAGSNIATRAVHATPGSNTRPFANGGLIALANGGIMDARGGVQGIVSKPTYLVGEGRYNEAVVPLPNGKAIPVQMHGGGQSNNVSVNVNISNSGQVQTETQGQDMGNLGQAIAVAVQKELIAQKMPGGILNRYGAA